jgi:hypothetical protein
LNKKNVHFVNEAIIWGYFYLIKSEN